MRKTSGAGRRRRGGPTRVRGGVEVKAEQGEVVVPERGDGDGDGDEV